MHRRPHGSVAFAAVVTLASAADSLVARRGALCQRHGGAGESILRSTLLVDGLRSRRRA